MPYRTVRAVNRGVQDDEELRKIKEEEKKKKREKAKKWCAMIGVTVVEFVLCLICFALAYCYYHTMQSYRNAHGIRHHRGSVRFILLPPAPLAIASAFLTLTYIDLVSWQTLRPITYFGWIMVATGGFLLFLLYAGVILLSTNAIIAIVAVVFGCITALVFLADLICMLLTLKRFPVPYWVLKRKYEKLDQCVCTGDRDLEEEEVERPICRCGDHWGEPCTCDDPDTTCGCGAVKHGKPPCECCECAAQALVEQDADGTVVYGSKDSRSLMVDSMAGEDFIEERQRTSLIQADFPMGEACTHRTHGVFCVDGPAPYSAANNGADTYSVNRAASQTSRKTAGTQSQITVGKTSPSMHRSGVMKAVGLASPSMMSTARNTNPSRMNYNTLASPSTARSLASPSTARSLASPSMARSMASPSTMSRMAGPSTTSRLVSPSRMANPVSTTRGLGPPPTELAAKLGSPHADLSQKLGSPSMMMASRLAINKPLKPGPWHHRPQQMTYPVYTTTLDDHETLQKSIASKYECQKKELTQSPKRKSASFHTEIQTISRSSTDEEVGEGDYSRKRAASHENSQEETLRIPHNRKVKQDRARLRFSTFTKTDCTGLADSEGGYTSDPETAQGPRRISMLPGQVTSFDDSKTFITKKNVSVSARERSTRRPLSDDDMRPRTSIEVLSAPRVIRNVSTTVRAVRTLSRVIEADNESRSVSQSDGNRESDRFPSECTITIAKGHYPTEK